MSDLVCQTDLPCSFQIKIRVTAVPPDGSSSAIDAIKIWFAHRCAKGGWL